MKTLKKFLKNHNACEAGFEFAKGLTLEQFLNTCDRGDWILWIFKRTNPSDKRTRVLVAAHCANTVRHLMTDKRSIDAVDMAIKYGNNEATDNELAAAEAAAWAATWANSAADAAAEAAAEAAAAAARANTSAYAASGAAGAAARAAGAAARAAARAADARKSNQKLTADICRQYLPIEIWNNEKL